MYLPPCYVNSTITQDWKVSATYIVTHSMQSFHFIVNVKECKKFPKTLFPKTTFSNSNYLSLKGTVWNPMLCSNICLTYLTFLALSIHVLNNLLFNINIAIYFSGFRIESFVTSVVPRQYVFLLDDIPNINLASWRF